MQKCIINVTNLCTNAILIYTILCMQLPSNYDATCLAKVKWYSSAQDPPTKMEEEGTVLRDSSRRTLDNRPNSASSFRIDTAIPTTATVICTPSHGSIQKAVVYITLETVLLTLDIYLTIYAHYFI